MLYDWGTLTRSSPRRLERARELAAYVLTPGFSRAYYQQTLGVSNATVWKYTRWAKELLAQDPSIAAMVAANTGSITREDALRMAQRRGNCQLPFWSRLAICELANETRDVHRVAAMFRCSPRTIEYVRSGRCVSYDILTGERRISSSQAAPPARGWGSAHRAS